MDTRVGNGLETPIQLSYNNADSAYPSVLWSGFQYDVFSNWNTLYSYKHDIFVVIGIDNPIHHSNSG